MQVGDLVRIEAVPRGQGMDSLIGLAGVIMPTPTFPESWDHYINVFVENRIQVMYRDNLHLVQRLS